MEPKKAGKSRGKALEKAKVIPVPVYIILVFDEIILAGFSGISALSRWPHCRCYAEKRQKFNEFG
jgi:hypothetical protein